MRRIEKVTLGKMGIAGGLAIVVIVAFSIPYGIIPPLGNFLLPGGDVWTAPGEVPLYEELTIPGLSGDVTVYRDQWGIPHIYGTGEADLIFALGYVHAQDRLFQMDMARRQTRGQLSEILGDDYLETDKYNLLMGKEFWANETLKVMETSSDPLVKQIYDLLLVYCDGVNFYIQHHPDLPIEFGFLNYVPRDWTALDSLCFSKYMAEMLTWGYDDLDRMNAIVGLGGINYTELFGNPQPFQIPICPDYGNYSDITVPLSAGSTGDVPFQVSSAFNNFLTQVTGIPQEADRIAQGPAIGSNNWVVNGSHTSTGKPILCNDMHLAWNLPGIWYETHLVDITPGSDYNFYGFFIAGVPVPITGHNAHVGWGYTNVGYDVLDWYYYDAVDANNYWYKGDSKPYEKRTVTINVKGADPVQFEIKSTVHGPVMTDFLPQLAGNGMQNLPIACKWTAQNVTYEFLALYNMSHATNRAEFSYASRSFHVPAQNMIYADVDGNIGIRPTGLVPVRNDVVLPTWHTGNGTMPYNGSAGEGEWISYVPFDDLPYSENPAQGFLVSANQIVAGPNYLTQRSLQSDYDSGYRSRRINSLITSKIKAPALISVADMQQFQLDVFNVLAERLTPILLETLDAVVPSKSTLQQAAYDALKGWAYTMDKDAYAPSIFSVWVEAYRAETFKDEMTAYKSPLTPSYAVLENLTLNATTNTKWFDNIYTPGVEGRNITMVTAFNKSLAALNTFFATSHVSAWKWGDIHKATFKHITGLSALGAGPYPVNGTSYTVNPSWTSNYNSTDGTIHVGIAQGGASERVIMDFADLNLTLSVIPSGERGISTSKHYHDQLDMFLAGLYHVQYFAANCTCKWSTAWTESSILFKKGGA